MSQIRPIHPHFQYLLDMKEQALIDLYVDLRAFILDIYPNSIELLYHTHALTSVFSVTEKMSDGFCMLPIYSNHLNLGFHQGTLLDDPHSLLTGTGKLIRHIPVRVPDDYRNQPVTALVQSSLDLALEDCDVVLNESKIISRIKQL